MTKETEVQKPEHGEGKKHIIHRVRGHPLFLDVLFIIALASAAFGFLYWQDIQGKVYIEKAEITAPIISIGPATPGVLEKFYVSEGDMVSKSQVLAEVGGKKLTAETSGIIIGIKNTPGQIVTSQDPVVKMINPQEMRVIGRLQEDKGLKDIVPGQKVMFMVDAFPQKEYHGVVDSVGMTARQSDIVFSISDKREEREFEVRVLFDTKAYPELKNGMSAKMWVYK
ncbi:HlyD family secretion protein [Candidatus Bilamarchaeum dharawalense]|uniref:HlyD family secretion protein n=1 Tax=Candidatus Bilamarchaeum dharawalense TaxID=2885759 RepID=A0A5E4LL98_9ARCH|nr:HlyD family secretion protein [Candidatus Bilamarchaeum dharawalense]